MSASVHKLKARAEALGVTPQRESKHADHIFRASEIGEPLPELSYLVRGLGFVGGGGAPHLICGFGFSLKTMAVQSMALSIATGQATWGGLMCKRGRVLHVDLEQGRQLTFRRYQRLAKAMSIDLAEIDEELGVVMPKSIALSTEHASRWREFMTGRDLIIVDSLRAAMPGQDENDSGIRSGLDLLGSLSEETGCRACVIHHAKKPSGENGGDSRFSIRGSSAIFDAVDSAFMFIAEKDGGPVSVEHVKSRSHGELVKGFALTVEDTLTADGPRTGLLVRMHGRELIDQRRAERDQQKRGDKAVSDASLIRTILASAPDLGTRELRDEAKAMGLGAERINAAVEHLAASGELARHTEVRNGKRVVMHRLVSCVPLVPDTQATPAEHTDDSCRVSEPRGSDTRHTSIDGSDSAPSTKGRRSSRHLSEDDPSGVSSDAGGRSARFEDE